MLFIFSWFFFSQYFSFIYQLRNLYITLVCIRNSPPLHIIKTKNQCKHIPLYKKEDVVLSQQCQDSCELLHCIQYERLCKHTHMFNKKLHALSLTGSCISFRSICCIFLSMRTNTLLI